MSKVIIANWDGDFRVTADARAKNQTQGQEKLAMLISEGYANAFMTDDPGGDPKDWLVDPVGKTVSIDPLPPVPPPTNDEIYDQVIQNQKVFKALALVCADQFGMTPAQMKTAVKAKM